MQSHSESKRESTDDQVGGSNTLSFETQITGTSAAFTNASNFTMNNPSFIIHHGNSQNTIYHREKPRLSKGINKWKNLQFNFTIIPRHQIDSRRVICVRKGSRFFTAINKLGSTQTSELLVQEFEGSAGKQQWEKTLHCFPRCLNPHILDIIGISSPSISDNDPRYIVFKGTCKANPRRLIASLLAKRDRERLAACRQLSLK
ncbi:hypothetical protein GYMLUDRAFT_910517 [Collybiopsis luxurians FD-317 M1]|nr:hypothetical protein GYMLUDRAFT_910517 [Collybiopsis luxurians FD-317 M1]